VELDQGERVSATEYADWVTCVAVDRTREARRNEAGLDADPSDPLDFCRN